MISEKTKAELIERKLAKWKIVPVSRKGKTWFGKKFGKGTLPLAPFTDDMCVHDILYNRAERWTREEMMELMNRAQDEDQRLADYEVEEASDEFDVEFKRLVKGTQEFAMRR